MSTQQMLLREAFKTQFQICGLNILKGRMTSKWQDFVLAHIHSKRIRMKVEDWAPKFVMALWKYTLRCWQYRNDTFHADNNTEGK
jgi:hypothetical protein